MGNLPAFSSAENHNYIQFSIIEENKMNRRSVAAFVSLVLVSSLIPAAAEASPELEVPSAEFPTIQSAIDGASAGDVIRVAAGTYTENIWITNSDAANISVIGAGPGKSIIDGNGARPVTFYKRYDNGGTLSGFTITNGDSRQGGAVYVSRCNNAVLSNLVMSGNKGEGGVVFINRASSTLDHVTVVNNQNTAGYVLKGAIYTEMNSACTLTNSIIWGNTGVSSYGQLNATSIGGSSTITVSYSIFLDSSGYVVDAGNNLNSDPLVDGNFMLQDGSPAINAGSDGKDMGAIFPVTCVEDCAGECGGTAVADLCGICNGSGIPEGNCDCNGNVTDCAGVCGGDAVEDNCGTCDSDASNDCIQDCEDALQMNFIASSTVDGGTNSDGGDRCNTTGIATSTSCETGHFNKVAWCAGEENVPSAWLDINLLEEKRVNRIRTEGLYPGSQWGRVTSFTLQYIVDGSWQDVTDPATGVIMSFDDDDAYCYNDLGSGSFQQHCGMFCDHDLSLYNLNTSSLRLTPTNYYHAPSVRVQVFGCDGGAGDVYGCTDAAACNYPADATEDDSRCLVLDCAGMCGGTAVEDCAGVCGGSAVEDCAGVCGGTAVLSGCDNACNSTAVVDCAGVCGGDSVLSGCDNACNSTAVEDCAGVCGGSSVLDECQVCNGSGIPEGECDCNGNVLDCAGVCGGTAIVDACGVCGGTAPDRDRDGTPDCFDMCPDGVDICASELFGDFNCDGFVNLLDIATIFAKNWLTGVEGSEQCAYDCQPSFDAGVASVDITSDNEKVCNDGDGIWDQHLLSCSPSSSTMACTCPPGFVSNNSGCVDIDECLSNNGGCDVDASCINNRGSFTCVCNPGFTGDGTTCSDINECEDPNGYVTYSLKDDFATDSECVSCVMEHVGWWCNDYMEDDWCKACADGTGTEDCSPFSCAKECLVVSWEPGYSPCDPLTECINFDGGFSCSDCPTDYTGTGETGCHLNECSASITHNCHPDATCTDEIGSPGFSCLCKSGYEGNGVNCVDIEECDTAPCGVGGTCSTPSLNSYTCTCDDGFTGGGEKNPCIDIDECETNNGDCGDSVYYSCTNNTGAAPTCADIDECAGEGGGNPCDINATCNNVDGDAPTCTCPAGFDGDGFTCEYNLCSPVPSCLIEHLAHSYQFNATFYVGSKGAVGQSFTVPADGEIGAGGGGFVTRILTNTFYDPVRGVRLRIRKWVSHEETGSNHALTGKILATSYGPVPPETGTPTILNYDYTWGGDTNFPTVEFNFDGNLFLQAGETYVIEFVGGYKYASGGTGPYSGGRAYDIKGNAATKDIPFVLYLSN